MLCLFYHNLFECLGGGGGGEPIHTKPPPPSGPFLTPLPEGGGSGDSCSEALDEGGGLL